MTTTMMSFRQALNDALRLEMERDPTVVLLGEDIGRHGGARGVTRGLLEQFGGERVIDMPISEMAISGASLGMAITGMRPVVEFYMSDIIVFMADMLVTSAARVHFSTSGRLRAPMVMRGADASRVDGGPHQDSLAAWFANVPGLKVLVPATPADAKGLLASAIRDDNPVIVFEPHRLYDMEGPVPTGEHLVAIGRAEVRTQGADVTVVAVGGCMPDVLAAHERWLDRGVSMEVVDPRSLRPLDTATVRESVRKTGRLVVVHEGWTTYGIGAEIVACVSEGPELLLSAPAQRVGTAETHLPASIVLSKAVLPNAARIDAAVERAMAGGRKDVTKKRAIATP